MHRTEASVHLQVATAWSRLSSKCNINSGIQQGASNSTDIAEDLRILHSFELSEHTVAWFLEYCRNNLIDSVAPKFWSHFDGLTGFEGGGNGEAAAHAGTHNAEQMRSKLSQALGHATEALQSCVAMAKRMEEEFGEEYMVVQRCRADFTAMLFGSSVPKGFSTVLRVAFQDYFTQFSKFVRSGGQVAFASAQDIDGQDVDMNLDVGDDDESDSEEAEENEEDGDTNMQGSSDAWDEERFRLMSRNLALVSWDVCK
jgi:hypothetical protein